MRRAPDAGCPRAFQRRSRFDAHEVFPEPAKRADPAAAGAHGEIALYGEIERRLRKRGIVEPARDLETLKQILEALQLKGLLHHTPTLPPHVRTAPAPPWPPRCRKARHGRHREGGLKKIQGCKRQKEAAECYVEEKAAGEVALKRGVSMGTAAGMLDNGDRDEDIIF